MEIPSARTGISKISPAFPDGAKKEISSTRDIEKVFSISEMNCFLLVSEIVEPSSLLTTLKPIARTSAPTTPESSSARCVRMGVTS